MQKIGNNFAFIDSQNLHLSIRELGCEIRKAFVAPKDSVFVSTFYERTRIETCL